MISAGKNTSHSMPAQSTSSQSNLGLDTKPSSNAKGKAVVIGLYGIPGSGKSYLLTQLKQELGKDQYAFYEGSEVIAANVPGGLDAFKSLERKEKIRWRQTAIESIGKESMESGKVAVVTGHLMFWREGEETGRPVQTQSDWKTYTHILYLKVPGDIVAQRRRNDKERRREPASPVHLSIWRLAEESQLRDICYRNNILFSTLSPDITTFSRLIRDFRNHNKPYNLSYAESRLDEALSSLTAGKSQLETMVVLDADRTLAAEDTGTLFLQSGRKSNTLKDIFSSPMAYSYTAFRQAALLYGETANDEKFDARCEAVVSMATLYPEFASLLRLVKEQKHIGAVIITCRLRLIWEKILEREGLSNTVKVIGGGRIADGFIVTGAVKAP